MKTWLVFLACALPLQAGILDTPDRLPGGTDAVFALDLAAGAIPRASGAMSLSAKASEAVIAEQLTGFATETGIDLNGPVSLVVAGPRANPDQLLAFGRLKIDVAKFLAVIKPFAGKMALEVQEVGGGVLLLDRKVALFLKDGGFLLGQRANVEAKVAGGATSPDTKVVADELTARAGANATAAVFVRTPEGLPGTPPPPSLVAGQQLAGFWAKFRGAFAAVRERDFALELVFDGPDAAGAALPVVNGWLQIVESQLAAEEARARTAAQESGPFRHLNGRWVAARLSLENFKQLRGTLGIKADGPALAFSVPRDLFNASSAMMGTALVGVLAAIAVPNFTKARERANERACFANQKTIVGAAEMYRLDKNVNQIKFTPEFFETLKKDGYLMSVPTDPGQGEGTASNYYEVPTGNGIACKVHGSVDGSVRPQGSANPMDAGLKSIFGK